MLNYFQAPATIGTEVAIPVPTALEVINTTPQTLTNWDSIIDSMKESDSNNADTDGKIDGFFVGDRGVEAYSRAGFLPTNDHFLKQASVLCGIPTAYTSRLLEEGDIGLLAHNLNERWTGKGLQNTERLIRLRNGTARALLSTSYKIYDNLDLVLAIDKSIGAYLRSEQAEVSFINSDDCLSLDIAFKDLFIGEELGDPQNVGLTFRNSEIGTLSTQALLYLFRLVCKNGMTFRHNYGTTFRHIGRRDIPQQIEDVVYNISDAKGYLENLAIEANSRVLPPLQNIDAFSVALDLAPIETRLSGAEKELAFVNYNRENFKNLYGLSNSVTYCAHELPDTTPNIYGRRKDLEIAGGELLGLTANKWKKYENVIDLELS